jgi:hypothetical protein
VATGDPRVSKHDEKPTAGDNPDDLRLEIDRLRESRYYEYVCALAPLVTGKIVRETTAGSSGYVVRFDDGGWAASYLDESMLRYDTGTGAIPRPTLARINSGRAGDGSGPISADLPYSDQPCDLCAELAKCEGKEVVGLAYGANSYSLCFPEGRELEAIVVTADDGRPALRVFWEQW